MKGTLITCEGPDGSGKSTLYDGIKENLHQHNIDFFCAREPGGTAQGEKIRELLLNGQHMDPRTELLLMQASRVELVNAITPALAEGKLVLLDRYYDSSTVYQGYGRKVDLNMIAKLNHFTTNGLVPDRTYLCLLSREQARERLKASGKPLDRIEREPEEFHTRIHSGYEQLAQQYPGRICVVDATMKIEDVLSTVIRDLQHRFPERFPL